jgi:spore coat protein U-like protein
MPLNPARLLLLLGLALLAGLATGGRAQAQSCTFNVTPLVFGPVDVTANVATEATATVSVTCTGLLTLPVTVGVCIDFGPGSAGATSATDRYMVNGSNILRYGLYTAGGVTPWGSSTWPAGGAAPVGFNLNPPIGGSVTRTETLVGRVHAGQPTAAPLAYNSVLSGVDARIRYGLLSFLLGCDLLTVTQTISFSVAANVPPTCRVTASTLDFGSTGVLSSARDASSTLTPTCTNGTSYHIGLNGGLSGASDPTLRRMVKGGESVIYGLYRDPGRGQAFGSTQGVDTVAGTGTGLAQALSVYGRVPAQATPSPGAYSDTVVATITY